MTASILPGANPQGSISPDGGSTGQGNVATEAQMGKLREVIRYNLDPVNYKGPNNDPKYQPPNMTFSKMPEGSSDHAGQVQIKEGNTTFYISASQFSEVFSGIAQDSISSGKSTNNILTFAIALGLPILPSPGGGTPITLPPNETARLGFACSDSILSGSWMVVMAIIAGDISRTMSAAGLQQAQTGIKLLAAQLEVMAANIKTIIAEGDKKAHMERMLETACYVAAAVTIGLAIVGLGMSMMGAKAMKDDKELKTHPLEQIGAFLKGLSHTVDTLNQAFQHGVQADYAPIMASFEAQKTFFQTMADNARKQLENSGQTGQELANLLSQALKMFDDAIQAHKQMIVG